MADVAVVATAAAAAVVHLVAAAAAAGGNHCLRQPQDLRAAPQEFFGGLDCPVSAAWNPGRSTALRSFPNRR